MTATAGHLNLTVRPDQLPNKEHEIKLVDGNTAAGCLIRTEDYKKLKGFDTKFKDIFQDVDLMIRIPQVLNKFNYCNRQSQIIHLDNASRVANSKIDPKRLQQMREDTLYLKHKCDTFNWKKKIPEQVDFSIITTVYNLDNYKDLLKSLENQNGNHTIEIIPIPNFYNHFDNMYKALNCGIEVSNGKQLIFAHDDIVVSPEFLNQIKYNIQLLNNANIQYGVLGPAGVLLDQHKFSYYLLDENLNKIEIPGNNINNTSLNEVHSLDEMCLIINKYSGLKFNDRQLSGFHFYGINLCLNAKLQGLRNYSINCFCHHKSDGNKNLNSKEKFESFVDQALKFTHFAKNIGVTNWRSTTTHCTKGHLVIYAIPPIIKESLNKDTLVIKI